MITCQLVNGGTEISARAADRPTSGQPRRGRNRVFPMKRLILATAFAFGWISAAWAAQSAVLTSLQAIHLLTHEDASRALPVAFEATITYVFPNYQHTSERALTVQDGDEAMYIQTSTNKELIPGDRVLVKGTTVEGTVPTVHIGEFTVLRHGALPEPIQVTYSQLMHSQHDSMLVTMRGVVRAAEPETDSHMLSTTLAINTSEGLIFAVVDSNDLAFFKGLLDAEVEVTGTAGGDTDGKLQRTGVILRASSVAGVRVLKRASADPWSLPVTDMGGILAGYRIDDLTGRIRVHGTITYYQPGSAVVLQDGSKSLWIATTTLDPLRVGDFAEATGFPGLHNGYLILNNSEIKSGHVGAVVTPQPATWDELISSERIFDLVSTEGKVITAIREEAQDEYVLVVDGHMFSASYRHPDAGDLYPVQPMKQIPVGSTVRVSGICVLESSDRFHRDVPFDILMRSPADMTIIAKPSPLNIRNLMILAGLLVIVAVIAVVRGWMIDRKARRQSAATAALEKKRSAILEDINGARPLAEIIEEIVGMVSSSLCGVPCWCEVAGGARLGNNPGEADNLRIVRMKVNARSGPALGTLYAALDVKNSPSTSETEVLHGAARLVTLAIETRRLNSDLRHRSEFDLLTEIHNRFSLDKRLDELVEEATANASIFGLIYIDLDRFKQINDRYGHRIGDIYLQEAAARMKKQLRGGDTLARLGGDEFAALISEARSRSGVEEIALRLERCFDPPFMLEGYTVHGSASIGIALYPEDGANKENLLSAADGSMYKVKNRKRQLDKSLAQSP